jgi:WS/DGAT/MGAT family acyltransferase
MADRAAPDHDADHRGPVMQFHHRMSDADALMWSIEKDPMLRSTITSVAMLEGTLDTARLRQLFERASRVVPRLRQRVRSNPLSLAPPRWEVDPNFDLNYHMRHVNAPGDGSLADILVLAEPIAMQSFDRARPLWECTYVHIGEERSALILKIHHSITDGVGGVRLMLEVFDLEPDAIKSPMPEAPKVHVLNQAERFLDAFSHQLRRQVGMVKRLAAGAGHTAVDVATHPVDTAGSAKELAESMARLLTPATRPLSPIMTGRSLSTHFEVIQLPLEPMKAAGHAVGGKLNDAFVGGILLGIRHYHTQRGADLQALRMSMPINVRTEHDQDVAGNAFVPTGDPRTLMERTHERLYEIVHEPANALVEPMANAINRLPTTFSTALFGSMMKGLDFQASNVPGSPFRLYLCGVPVTLMVPFGPMAGAAANITLLSYVEELNIGVNVDPAAVTNPTQYVACLRQAYDEIMAVGTHPRSRRHRRDEDSSSAPSRAAPHDGASSNGGGRRGR